MEKQRVIVYVDGYNLYYGLRVAYGKRYRWLNIQTLAESFLKPGMELICIKYFTAIATTKGYHESKQRQEIYLTALEACCDKIKIYYGRFLSKFKKCPNCHNQYQVYEEKKTDVNIACQMLNDAHSNQYDRCYLVSGDSDLVPPLQIVKENYPNKHTIVAHPPKRKSTELCDMANGWFAISKQKLQFSQMPEKIMTSSGNELTKPTEWR